MIRLWTTSSALGEPLYEGLRRRQHPECRASSDTPARARPQLASAILADAGMVNRFGKVDEGTTVTDFDEEEIARKHTLSASLAYAEWNKHEDQPHRHARHRQFL